MRGKQAPKRKLKPDVKYSSTLVTRFINYIMKDGKKSIAQKIVYDCFAELEKRIESGKIEKEKCADALTAFDIAVKNVTPQLEVRGRRIGGGNYQIPYPVRGERKHYLALHWILTATKNKKGKPFSIRLADELTAAIIGEGDAMKKRSDVHKMAESNKAFAHFARF